MKKLLIVFMMFCSVLKAQENMNILSYYASDNSLDGQPRIDMTNILRFFPVYAILENINEVYVIVYYGSKIYESNADKMSGGDYWQTLLPEFKLGDAIQRVEVEMSFNLNSSHSKKIKDIDDEIEKMNTSLRNIQRQPYFKKFSLMEKELSNKIDGYNFSVFRKAYDAMNMNINIDSIKIDSIETLNKLKTFLKRSPSTKDIPGAENDREILREEYLNYFRNTIGCKDSIEKDLNFIKNRYAIVKDYQDKKKELYQKKNMLQQVKDSTSKLIFNDIVGELADTSFTGPSIRKSDLIISDDFKSARLLYRYYKNNLRYRKALDPAENLGIFRARYVPFPVVGTPRDNKVQLLRPMEANVPVVFEIGLSFGDDVVSGDNTFNPTFSLSRLGVAIVITEKLFKADAEILGLALTYDFNSYASIGFGRNLAQGQSYPYLSFGINKKAFEQLLAGLAGLFQ